MPRARRSRIHASASARLDWKVAHRCTSGAVSAASAPSAGPADAREPLASASRDWISRHAAAAIDDLDSFEAIGV